MNSLIWEQPLWLLGLGLPLIAWLIRRTFAQRRQTDYADAALWPWVIQTAQTRAGTTHAALMFLGWTSLMIALAHPLWPQTQTPDTSRSGVDIVILLDASRSMTAEDVSPSRFEQARQISESLALRLQADDRIGLIAFAGQAHWISPVSQDPALFKRALYLIDAHQLPLAGSRLNTALSFAQNQLAAIQRTTSVIIILTDGGGIETAPPAALAEQQRIVIAVGSERQTWLKDSAHPTGWLHKDNQPVNLALNQQALQNWAQQGNMTYFSAQQSQTLLDAIHNRMTQITPGVIASAPYNAHQSLRPYFIALAVFAFLLILPLPQRLPLPSLMLIVVAGLFTSHQAWSSPHQAHQLFQAQNWAEAEQAYQQLKGFDGLFGAGNAAYRQQHFERAAFWYRQAILAGATQTHRAHALFNLGNAYMQLQAWGLAIEAYQAAQAYHPPAYPAAEHNLTLAQAALEQAQAQQARLLAEAEAKAKETDGVRKDLEGSFHGGEKPDPNNEAGSGALGESDDGRAETGLFNVRLSDTENTLQTTPGVWQVQTDASGEYTRLQRQRRIQQLELDLDALEDQAHALLLHLFEREAGFEAKQTQIHTIEGVEPW